MDRDEEFYSQELKESRHERKRVSQKDRSKYKKTDADKRKRRLKEESEEKLVGKKLKRGRVLSILPEGISVDSEGERFLCVLGGVLKKEKSLAKNLVTVGDFVVFEEEKNLILQVEERKSLLERQEHLKGKKAQAIAANIDQVIVTVSFKQPGLKPSLVDRYIIASRKGEMEPVIVINKIDLVETEEEREFLQDFVATYLALGLKVILLSAKTGEGVQDLKEAMKDRASVFSGQSGVGKSSLINAMTELDLPTGEIVKKTQKGAHTTTWAELLILPFGGFCIDTPGIRSFGVWRLSRDDLEAYFPEIQEKGRSCKYPNCTHSHEPECAVQEAVEEGEISPLRFDSYLKLLDEIDRPTY